MKNIYISSLALLFLVVACTSHAPQENTLEDTSPSDQSFSDHSYQPQNQQPFQFNNIGNMTPEERQARMEQRGFNRTNFGNFVNMTSQERQHFMEQRRQQGNFTGRQENFSRSRFANMTDEERAAIRAQFQNNQNNDFGSQP